MFFQFDGEGKRQVLFEDINHHKNKRCFHHNTKMEKAPERYFGELGNSCTVERHDIVLDLFKFLRHLKIGRASKEEASLDT